MRTRQPELPPQEPPGRSATAELFRLRRIGVVDSWWFLGFVVGFALAGVLAFAALAADLGRSPSMAMMRYMITICLAGLAGGIVGAGVGHGLSSVWERWDLKRNPRRYESGSGGA